MRRPVLEGPLRAQRLGGFGLHRLRARVVLGRIVVGQRL